MFKRFSEICGPIIFDMHQVMLQQNPKRSWAGEEQQGITELQGWQTTAGV